MADAVLPPRNFWSWQASNTPNTVVKPTSGDLQDKPPDVNKLPYANLPGSGTGISSPEIDASYQRTFPPYSRSNLPGPVPAVLQGPFPPPAQIDVNDFRSWHSVHQDAYVREKLAGGTDTVLAIGTGANTLYVTASAVKSPGIYILNDLGKRDFAKMPGRDQGLIAASDYFRNTIAPRYGLVPSGGTTYGAAQERQTRLDMEAKVRALVNTIVGDDVFTFFTSNDSGLTWTRTGTSTQIKEMTAADAELFLKQAQNVLDRIRSSLIYSPADIDSALAAIEKRWDRARAFANVSAPDKLEGLDRGAIGLTGDGLDDVRRGYKALIAQEARLMQLDEARAEIARTGVVKDKSLDVPNLVFLLQLNYNLTIEARVTADAEEVNQFNTLLKMYSAIQDLVNRTMGEFDTSDTEQKKGLLGKDKSQTVPANLFDNETRALVIFEDALGNQKHPLEQLYGIDRPTFDMVWNAKNSDNDDRVNALNEYLRTKWETFGTRLADKVTLINQESQIKTNDINSLDKQKNRHFDLANGALSKMSDMIQAIGRNVS